jgi:hypothetical protein
LSWLANSDSEGSSCPTRSESVRAKYRARTCHKQKNTFLGGVLRQILRPLAGLSRQSKKLATWPLLDIDVSAASIVGMSALGRCLRICPVVSALSPPNRAFLMATWRGDLRLAINCSNFVSGSWRLGLRSVMAGLLRYPLAPAPSRRSWSRSRLLGARAKSSFDQRVVHLGTAFS